MLLALFEVAKGDEVALGQFAQTTLHHRFFRWMPVIAVPGEFVDGLVDDWPGIDGFVFGGKLVELVHCLMKNAIRSFGLHAQINCQTVADGGDVTLTWPQLFQPFADAALRGHLLNPCMRMRVFWICRGPRRQ